MNSLSNTLKRKIATKLQDVQEERSIINTQKEMGENVHYQNGAVQDYIPLLDIKDGVFITKDHRYVACMEFAPVNFHKMTEFQQKEILKTFSNIFTNGPVKISIQILSDKPNPEPIIKSVLKNCPNQDDPKIAKELEDYINHIQMLSRGFNVSSHRFFIQFEYYHDQDEKKAKKEEEILSMMAEQRKFIVRQMENCGNVCLDNPKNRNLQMAEFLYYFFNRQTSKLESFRSRYDRIEGDFKAFDQITGMKKKPIWNDMICPKGISFTHNDYVLMDGTYYGYIGITGNSWPSSAVYAWSEFFLRQDEHYDFQIICRKVPKGRVTPVLKQMNKMTFEAAKEADRKNKMEKAEQKMSDYKNNTNVYARLQNGEDIYDVALILTLRYNTYKELQTAMRLIKRDWKNTGMVADDCTFCTEQYFLMSLPFLYITSPFGRLKHNTLSKTIATLYPFTYYELLDKSGYVMGRLHDEKTLCAPDNFNSTRYPNGNTLITGSSGSGKTFTQQVIAKGMMMNGIKCRFIIPKKGYEYQPGCAALDGQYIKLGPNCADVINPFEIRPEDDIDLSVINLDDITIQRGVSLRAKKCNSLVEWYALQLEKNEALSRVQRAILIEHLNNMYEKFGITADNSSIFEDKKTRKLKLMPTAGDFQEEIKDDPNMDFIATINKEYVTGNYANMNQQTNVDLSNPYIVFDVDEDDIGSEMAPAFQYLAFDCVYDEARANVKKKKAIFLDEIWKMLKNESSAKMLENAIRIVRGYGACVIEATQQLNDCLNAPGDFGKAIIGNSEIKILLHMNDGDAALAQDALRLSQSDYDFLTHCNRGEALMMSQQDKIKIDIIASQRQIKTYTTDVNLR